MAAGFISKDPTRAECGTHLDLGVSGVGSRVQLRLNGTKPTSTGYRSLGYLRVSHGCIAALKTVEMSLDGVPPTFLEVTSNRSPEVLLGCIAAYAASLRTRQRRGMAVKKDDVAVRLQ